MAPILLADPWLSIVGGGLVASVLTLAFNAWWDKQKQKAAEDWEFKRYEANQIHFATAGLMEAYFASKTEFFYLSSALEALNAALDRLATQADAIVRQQGGPTLTVTDLEQKKAQLLQPFQKYNQEQVNLRWQQYEQKAKETHAKAEVHLRALQPLIEPELYQELTALFERLSTSFEWNLAGAKAKLATAEQSLPEVMAARQKLTQELEKKLGRKSGS